MSTYLIINLLIIIFPLLFSFERRLKFYRRWPAFLFSFFTTGLFFILWDRFFTRQQVWFFNEKHVSGFKILSLPFEEILFFVTAPYSCLFIFTALNYLIKDKLIKNSKLIKLVLLAVSFLIIVFNLSRTYTLVVGIVLLLTVLIGHRIFASRNYWYFIGLSFVGFLIFNYWLTSLPVVSYNTKAILNLRILTIPVEDFIYNFSMLTLYLKAFTFYINKFLPK